MHISPEAGHEAQNKPLSGGFFLHSNLLLGASGCSMHCSSPVPHPLFFPLASLVLLFCSSPSLPLVHPPLPSSFFSLSLPTRNMKEEKNASECLFLPPPGEIFHTSSLQVAIPSRKYLHPAPVLTHSWSPRNKHGFSGLCPGLLFHTCCAFVTKAL